MSTEEQMRDATEAVTDNAIRDATTSANICFNRDTIKGMLETSVDDLSAYDPDARRALVEQYFMTFVEHFSKTARHREHVATNSRRVVGEGSEA